jgi:class 3 adenylate cyclase/HAMP domain-containing protein
MTQKSKRFTDILSTAVFSLSYRLIEKYRPISGLVRKGGIRFKWAAVVSSILLVMVILFISLFTIMSSDALVSANDLLCKTIAGTISSTESILTAERKTMTRSLILQDLVNGLMKNKINGLQYIAVYDLRGLIVEKKGAYAASSIVSNRAKVFPGSLFDEINRVESFQKQKIIYKDIHNKKTSSFQYRLPLRFFNARVGVIELVFTEASILEPVNKARMIIIAFSFVLLLMGIVITVIVAKGMVSPIKNLFDGMTKVRKGNLEIKLDVNRHDEIGDLSTEFNNLIIHLREKLQMQKFVSETTVSMIHKETASGNISLGGTRRYLAFLFSDIRGFTAMSEKMEPEEVVTLLNEYLDLQARTIKKFEGDIDKYVGDEVMAVFSGDNKADNAIACAIEIIDKIKELNKNKTDTGLQSINVGIGLNIGYVVQGRMGSSDRMDNTCIGDTVNLASRLCSQAKSGAILASSDMILKSTRNKFRSEKLDPIKVKGKENLIEIFAVTGMNV